MNLTPKKKKKLTLWVIGIAAACIAIVFGLKNFEMIKETFSWIVGLVMPLIIGIAIAMIINVPMGFFEKLLFPEKIKRVKPKLKRLISFLISIVLIFGILAGVVWLVIPELVDAVAVIVDGALDYTYKISNMSMEEIAQLPFGKLLLNIDWNKTMSNVQQWIKEQGGVIVDTAVGTVSSVAGGVYDFFIACVFAIYIIFNKETLKRQVSKLVRVWVPKKVADTTIHATTILGKNFKSFVSGQSLEAVILGVMCMIGMLILRIPYAPMVGALVGVTAIIPVVGGFIGAGVGAFMILTVSPVKAVVFVVFILVLQQIEGNVIYPKVMGNSVSLPSMWILAAVTIGGGIAGAIGMLLSVPIASTIYTLVCEATQKRESKNAITETATDTEKDDELV
ncbi:MAG: AI-2E family transporter [Ruminococcus sp.]|nr:AI-2E family transporter [Ruminococcus sp.]